MFLISCSQDQKLEVETGVSRSLAEYRKEHLSDLNYQLSFDIPENKTESIAGTTTISFQLDNTDQDLQIDFKEDADHIHEITVNKQGIDIDFHQEHIIIPKENLELGANEIQIDFTAGDQSLNRNDDYLYTLLVPDRARTVFPLFDQPNLKAIYSLDLIIPTNWKAQANGPLTKRSELSNGKVKLEFGKTKPISSYLFAFTAGAYKSATSEDGNMTMLYRETDEEKVKRNTPEIFQLHQSSLDWLEDYTEIDYPFQKFDFALIPSFQYGGMEHVGAIFYNERSLMLDKEASINQKLRRGSLIAHETAHMWFGDLVTMDWFDDVWLKEVFANFMAAKIVNPSFPEVNHDLRFLLAHYPTAYSIDRSNGSHPIQQELPNLNNAGTLYGGIIYQKAPIVMRMLERLIGASLFQEGLQEYLTTYSYANATWDDLISIMQKRTQVDLNQWNNDWVKSAGRPTLEIDKTDTTVSYSNTSNHNVWPQQIRLSQVNESRDDINQIDITIEKGFKTIQLEDGSRASNYNYKGEGYAYIKMPQSELTPSLGQINQIADDQERAAQWMALWEELLHGRIAKQEYLKQLYIAIEKESNPLALNYISSHISTLYWSFFDEDEREATASTLENELWKRLQSENNNSLKRTLYNVYISIANTEKGRVNLVRFWKDEVSEVSLNLSSRDKETLAYAISVRDISGASDIYNQQLENSNNPDDIKRMNFVRPALSNDANDRDQFFQSLKDESNRSQERWVLTALTYLHHPLRQASSKKYVLPSLELIEEIQTTGDIFFPKRWLDNTLGSYRDADTKAVVKTFLESNPTLSKNLKNKINQAADMLLRSELVI